MSLRNLVLKALLLFVIANLLCAAGDPLPALGRASLYNGIFPGRPRLPYGERPDLAYNLSLYNLEAMFASHEIAALRAAAPKPTGELRVVLIGDSSTWGFLLRPEDTLAALLNRPSVRVYNLGYPTMSVTKDLLLLQYALRYQPDLIIWLTTLESLPRDKQLSSPIVQNNAGDVRKLIATYNLKLDPVDSRLITPSMIDRTIWGERRALADVLRLQVYGVMWAATGIDQYYPETYDSPQNDLDADETFQGLKPPTLRPSALAFDVLQAGAKMAGDVPILFVNEPIFVSNGQNSAIRYNFFYPRWAYDQYRQMFAEQCAQNAWRCLDAWNLVPAGEFTNSAIHRSPKGESLLAKALNGTIQELIGEK